MRWQSVVLSAGGMGFCKSEMEVMESKRLAMDVKSKPGVEIGWEQPLHKVSVRESLRPACETSPVSIRSATNATIIKTSGSCSSDLSDNHIREGILKRPEAWRICEAE